MANNTAENEPLLTISSPIDSCISPIIGELTKDLETISQLEQPLSDADPIVLNLCKTLESALRHGLLRPSQKDSSDFFDVVLALYDQQNTFGRKTDLLKRTFWDTQYMSDFQFSRS